MDSPLFEDAREHLEPGSFERKKPKPVEEIAEGSSGFLTCSMNDLRGMEMGPPPQKVIRIHDDTKAPGESWG